MNYYSEITNRLKAACGASSVATIAAISSSEWLNNHIFVSSGTKYIHSQNRGRVPYIVISRATSDYSFDAVSTNDIGGILTSTWNIQVVVGTNSRSSEETNETLAYSLALKAIKEIRSEVNMVVGNEQIGTLEVHPFGFSLTVTLTIENTHSISEK